MPPPLTDSTVHIPLHSSSPRLDRQDERLDSSLPGIPSNIAGADPVALWNRLLSPQGVVQMMAINTLNVSLACTDDTTLNVSNSKFQAASFLLPHPLNTHNASLACADNNTVNVSLACAHDSHKNSQCESYMMAINNVNFSH